MEPSPCFLFLRGTPQAETAGGMKAGAQSCVTTKQTAIGLGAVDERNGCGEHIRSTREWPRGNGVLGLPCSRDATGAGT